MSAKRFGKEESIEKTDIFTVLNLIIETMLKLVSLLQELHIIMQSNMI
jgi:hypothetical protein